MDGVDDGADNCAFRPNPAQEDEDADGVGDGCDNCPGIANADQANVGEINASAEQDLVGDVCDPRPSEAGDSIVLFDGFNGTLDGWTPGPDEATWAVTDGVLQQTSGAAMARRFFRDDLNGSAWAVEVRLRMGTSHVTSGTQPPQMGVMVGVNAANGTGAACMIQAPELIGDAAPSNLSIRTIAAAGGTAQIVVQQPLASAPLQENRWYTLTGVMDGPAVRCTVDGVTVSGMIPTPAGLSSGLRVYGAVTDYAFVTIYELGSTPQPPVSSSSSSMMGISSSAPRSSSVMGVSSSAAAPSSSAAAPSSSAAAPSSSAPAPSSSRAASSSAGNSSSAMPAGNPFGQVDGSQVAYAVGSTPATYGMHVYLPNGYSTDTSRRWPLVVFLHGAGEQVSEGASLNAVKRNGPPKLIDQGTDYDAVVVSPQSVNWWNSGSLNTFVDWLYATYRLDADRFYLTGLSMGGGGTADYAKAYPTRPAAIVPVCPATNGNNAEPLFGLPAWYFHAFGDGTVGFGGSTVAILNRTYSHSGEDFLDEYRAGGGSGSAGVNRHVIGAVTVSATGVTTDWQWQDGTASTSTTQRLKATVYPDSSHNSWDRAYNTAEMWTWLFAQTRRPVNGLNLTAMAVTPNGLHRNVTTEIQLRATATDSDGTITGVFADLDGSGSGHNQPLMAQGSNLYQRVFTPPLNQSLGRKRLFVMAADNQNNLIMRTLELSVFYPRNTMVPVGTSGFSVMLNMTSGGPLSATTNWNDLIPPPGNGQTYRDFQTSDGRAVPWTLTVAGSGVNTGAAYESSNAAFPHPLGVVNSFWETTGTMQLRVTGLDPALRYRVTFFGRRADTAATPASRGITYRVGGQQSTINITNNTQLVFMDNLMATNGELLLEAVGDPATYPGNTRYARLNAVIIDVMP